MQTKQELRFGPFRLDPEHRQLHRGQQEVNSTPKALGVLCVLVARAGQVVTKEEFFQAVWPQTVVSDDALTTCILELRQALRDDAKNPRYIETIHRRGYRFIGKVVRSQEEVVRSQQSRVSRAEGQTANGEGSLEYSVQSLESDEQKPVQTGQPLPPKLSDPRLSDPRPQTLDVSVSRRFWPMKNLTLTGVVLLVGMIIAVQYLSLPVPNTQTPSPNLQPLPLPDKPSLVVLPLVNLSGDSNQEYFSDGITEEIITALGRMPQVLVIARHSAFIYKGKAVKVQEVGKELRVQYVLEGSVRRAENRVRIIVRLVDAATGNLQWSERYDRPVADLFTVQDEIVQKITTTLKLQFIVRKQTGTMGDMASKPTDHLEAYDTFLRGLAYYWRLTKEDNLEARQLFERALTFDPQYAAAHELLGATYVMEWSWRWNPDPQNLERAFVLAQRAIALDDSSPGAHLILSEVYLGKNQLDRALAENERAIALEPNHADSYAQRANALIFTGRPAEAVPAAEQAVRLNPHAAYHLFELGWAYLMTGQEAQSMVALRRAITRNPDHVMAYVVLAFNYVSQWVCQLSQDPQILVQAREAAQHALALHDTLPAAHSALGFVYLWQKQYDQAIAELERGFVLDASFGCGARLLAGGLSMVGRIEEAVQVGEQALRLEVIPPDDCLLLLGGAYARAGRLEEAQTLLRRFLSRYPHKLPAHLELAAVYSELGREAEAQAEVAEVLRLNPQFSLEVYKQQVPIKDPTTLERHIVTLRKAGLK